MHRSEWPRHNWVYWWGPVRPLTKLWVPVLRSRQRRRGSLHDKRKCKKLHERLRLQNLLVPLAEHVWLLGPRRLLPPADELWQSEYVKARPLSLLFQEVSAADLRDNFHRQHARPVQDCDFWGQKFARVSCWDCEWLVGWIIPDSPLFPSGRCQAGLVEGQVHLLGCNSWHWRLQRWPTLSFE